MGRLPGYREVAPPPELARMVACFWSWRTSSDFEVPDRFRVLPDGCVDVIWDLSGPVAEAAVFGTMTRPLLIRSNGRIHLVAMRFRPGGAPSFLDCPADGLTDAREAVADVVPRWRSLGDQIGGIEEPDLQLAVLRDALLAKLPSVNAPDPLMVGAIDMITRSPAESRVSKIADRVGVSRQHLTRRVRALCGVGPKQLARIARLHKAIAMYHMEVHLDWASIAHRAGYCDQSHLTLDFKSLTDSTPAKYSASAGRGGKVPQWFLSSNTPRTE